MAYEQKPSYQVPTYTQPVPNVFVTEKAQKLKRKKAVFIGFNDQSLKVE